MKKEEKEQKKDKKKTLPTSDPQFSCPEATTITIFCVLPEISYAYKI